MRNILNFYLGARHHPKIYIYMELNGISVLIPVQLYSGANHKKGSKSSMDLLPFLDKGCFRKVCC